MHGLMPAARNCCSPAPEPGWPSDIGTRVGPVTVMFTGRATAWACPAAGAFTYRGRRYTGSVFVSSPGWHGSAGLGLRLHPAGTTAGRGISDTIAGIIGAAVAAHVRTHPQVLDLAAHTRARARQARAARDMELLAIEITAAEQHLAGLRSKQTQLRALAAPGHRAGPGGKPASTNREGAIYDEKLLRGTGKADYDLVARR
jgi:hypothetical protein